MTARVINDPSSLGWEYDADTGRWTWGGGSSSGGGNGTFPEAPVNGEQYARQDAGWAVIVHPDNGGGTIGTVTTADVKLTNPTLRSPIGLDTQEDANTYFYGELGKLIDEDGNVIGGDGGIPDAPADSAIYGRKDNDWVVVPTSGGGDGPDMSLYYTASQCDSKFQTKGTYDNYSGWNIKASGGTAQKVTKNYTVDFVGGGGTTVTRSGATITIHSSPLSGYYTAGQCDEKFQIKGNYITSEADPVFKASPAGSITQNDINKWNNPPSGGNDYDGSDAVKLTGDQSISGVKTFTQSTIGKNHYFSSTGSVGVQNKNRIAFSSDAKTTIYAGSGNANYIQVTENVAVTNKSFTAKGNSTAHQFIIDSSRSSAVIGYASGGQMTVSANGATVKAGTGSFQVLNGGANLTGNLSASGTITGTDCIATSDERLKENVTPVQAGVITQLQGVEFDWKDSGVKASGFIAQEVEEVSELQHLVHDISKEGHKGVSYMGMIPYLLEEIKSLRAEIEELKK